MKRKVKEYVIREAEFLETGRDMFFSRGYANTSINDIIGKMGVAKGTFYHYFDSKEDLLDKIVSNFIDKITVNVESIVNNMEIGAVEKFNTAYNSIRNLKIENMELMILLMNVLYSNENILLRHKMFKLTIQRMAPVWAKIIDQGIKEGVFNCSSPIETAEVIFAISTYLNEDIVQMFSSIKNNPGNIKKIKDKIRSFESAIARLLGSEEGKIKIFEISHLDEFMEKLSG